MEGKIIWKIGPQSMGMRYQIKWNVIPSCHQKKSYSEYDNRKRHKKKRYEANIQDSRLFRANRMLCVSAFSSSSKKNAPMNILKYA